MQLLFSHSVVSGSLQPHGLQHSRLPCPSPSPRTEVKWSSSVVSDSLRPHGLQHSRLPCPSPSPRVYSNSKIESVMQSNISSSVVPFSSHLHSFLASRSSQMSRFFASGSQSIGVSATTSVLPMNIQYWFPLGWLVRSPCSPRDSQESSPAPQKHRFFGALLSL